MMKNRVSAGNSLRLFIRSIWNATFLALVGRNVSHLTK